MIYSIITTEYGRVEEVKTFKNSADASKYFKEQSEWALKRFGNPDTENAESASDFDDFGFSEMVYAGGDGRVFITTHAMN